MSEGTIYGTPVCETCGSGKVWTMPIRGLAQWLCPNLNSHSKPIGEAVKKPNPPAPPELKGAREAATYSVSIIAEYLRQVSRFDGDLLEKNWNAMANYIKSCEVQPTESPTAKPAISELMDGNFHFCPSMGASLTISKSACESCNPQAPEAKPGSEAIPVSLVSPAPGPLTWTKEKPKVDGWYWCRNPMHPTETTTIEEVRANESGALTWRVETPDGEEWDPISDTCEWAGPIPEPQAKPIPPEAGTT